MNLQVSVSDLRTEEMVADKMIAEGLCVDVGTCFTAVGRVMRAEGRPVAYLVDSLPINILLSLDLDGEFRGSVLDYLVRSGLELQVSRAAISATNATAHVAKALEIQRDSVLLQFASQLYDCTGKVVDYSENYFIPGFFNFHVNRRVGKGIGLEEVRSGEIMRVLVACYLRACQTPLGAALRESIRRCVDESNWQGLTEHWLSPVDPLTV